MQSPFFFAGQLAEKLALKDVSKAKGIHKRDPELPEVEEDLKDFSGKFSTVNTFRKNYSFLRASCGTIIDGSHFK